MSIVMRPGTIGDAAACGTICYEAFRAIGTAHNFPPDFPSPDVASGVLSMLLAHPGFYSVVAESGGRSSAAISSMNDRALAASGR